MTAKEVVEAYSIALSKGDVPTAFSHFSPNAKWHQPGNNKFSGTQTGLEAIGKMLSEMMAVTQGSLAIKPGITVYIRNSNYTNPSNTAGYTHKMSIYSIQSWFYKCSQFKIMVKTNASYSRVSVNLQMSQF
jgi:hypothetical protein